MPWSITQADTEYDSTHLCGSLFNGPAQPAFRQSPYAEKLMAQAQMFADEVATNLGWNSTNLVVANLVVQLHAGASTDIGGQT